MKNQNQNFSNKRYKVYFGILQWKFGVIHDTTTNECCGIDNDVLGIIKEFCMNNYRFTWFNPHNYFNNKYLEFNSYEDFKQSYPELLI